MLLYNSPHVAAKKWRKYIDSNHIFPSYRSRNRSGRVPSARFESKAEIEIGSVSGMKEADPVKGTFSHFDQRPLPRLWGGWVRYWRDEWDVSGALVLHLPAPTNLCFNKGYKATKQFLGPSWISYIELSYRVLYHGLVFKSN